MDDDALAFRAATADDVDRLVEIHTSAFPDSRGEDARRRNFEANKLGGFDCLHVACVRGVVVAHAFSFPLEAWFGGRRVKVGAIATVGVAPEARGRGVAAGLLAHLHHAAHERGDAITMLYPFRQSFYARYGYAPVTPTKRLVLAPHAIGANFGAPDGVRAATGDDAPGIAAVYERVAAMHSGWLARSALFWERRFSDPRRCFFVRVHDHTVTAYVAWSLVQVESHARTKLVVDEMIADDDESRRALFALLRSQRDQVAEIEIEIAMDDPIDQVFVDIDAHRFGTEKLEHSLGVIAGGPMVRVHDVARAIAARGYFSGGSIDLSVDDEHLHVEIARGIAASRSTAASPSCFRTTRSSLAAILYGTLAPSTAVRVGLAHADPVTSARADALFALPPFFALDRF